MTIETKKTLGKYSFSVQNLVLSGIIAALYAALTLALAPISFGAMQFRVAEALTLLPMVSIASVPGLFLGCLLGNLLGGAPWQDILFGSLATLLAAITTRILRKYWWLAALMPVLFNGLIVGATLSVVLNLPFWLTVGTVALGEAAVCYMLGVPLINLLKKRFPDRLDG